MSERKEPSDLNKIPVLEVVDRERQIPTPAEVFGNKGREKTENGSALASPEGAPLDDSLPFAEELRTDTATDRAVHRLMSISARLHERRLTAQHRRDARNELTDMGVAALDSDDARAAYESRILEQLDADDQKIATYAQRHANSEFGRLNREVWREDAKNKLRSLGRSAVRGMALGLGVAVGTGILAYEAAGRGAQRSKDAAAQKAAEMKLSTSNKLSDAKGVYSDKKVKNAERRQERAAERADRAEQRSLRADERSAQRKELFTLFTQLADNYKDAARDKIGRREIGEPTPTSVIESQKKRTSRLGQLAFRFGAAREAFKSAKNNKKTEDTQDTLF